QTTDRGGAEGYAGSVALGDGFDDSETETAAAFRSGSAAVEAVERAGAIRFGNARATVEHFEGDPLVHRADAHLDLAALGAIAHGVVDQIAHQRAHGRGVAPDPHIRLRPQPELDVARLRERMRVRDRFAGRYLERHRLQLPGR